MSADEPLPQGDLHRAAERRLLRRSHGGIPAGAEVDVFYRASPFVAVRVVATGATFGGLNEERDLCPEAVDIAQVVSV